MSYMHSVASHTYPSPHSNVCAIHKNGRNGISLFLPFPFRITVRIANGRHQTKQNNNPDKLEYRQVTLSGSFRSGLMTEPSFSGSLSIEGIRQTEEYPELAAKCSVTLPDEKMRRVGQAVAAASLPALS